ncbi:DNA primase catalytic subunit PriS [Methanogenium organophilum]|uniref:DNA primase small subunit PriS n=1 Tax=Methanogenium organophilum TaxID=2199 RepID=A0A9X9T7K0_METOG|nr:DNA primase catalytic subunit PriS [Methanogenium organophilum]WAI00775.1 DNA primase catalytic subunit PriS [Methanogenium organophilum]
MNPATREYIRQKFAAYYAHAQVFVPPSLREREWGFIPFDETSKFSMRRHMAFQSREELASYVRATVPRHMYFSTAYYELPSAPTMNDKNWVGADLIFDLDADHIVQKVSYDVMLTRVKEETLKLIDMLTDELGFSKRSLALVFSGGRGYHIHIRDIECREWGSSQRRELVDYVCAIGIDSGFMLTSHQGGVGGWPARYRSSLREELQRIRDMGAHDGVKYLSSLRGVGEGSARSLFDEIDAVIASVNDLSSQVVLMKNNALRALTGEDYEPMKQLLRSQAALTDEPVTTDIKRLIRAPGSLHGGSGFRVTELASVADLERFDPLVDAVVDFGGNMVSVECPFPLTMPMMGQEYTIEKGVNRVPEELAVFLCCRGIGEITAPDF